MTVEDHSLTPRGSESPSPGPVGRGGVHFPFRRSGRRGPRPRLRKLRLLVVLVSVVLIAGIAAIFGMLTAVASDLPQLSNQAQLQSNVDSVLYDNTGAPIGLLAPPNNPVRDEWSQISQNMVHAIVSVEDRRFWTDPGIDLRGLARAFLSDVTGGPTQGASTIAEEFVKNVEQEENHRTILEKLREAGLAFQLVHRWKRTKILTEYLNIIYFGSGAYGVEAAARIYFGRQLGFNADDPNASRCGTPTVSRPHLRSCASLLAPYQAALLAGMVANPSAFDPILHPAAARGRRQVVLADMRAQGYITRAQYERAEARPLPQLNAVQQPTEPGAAPYFTSWVRPQIVAALEREGVPAKIAPYEAYYGGLKIKLTLNLQMQQAAQNAVDQEFPAGSNGPTASLVSIDNATGEVRAMVSGSGDYQADPFNLATLGYRQPGSSFKIFTLVQALESGEYSPASIIDSAPQDIPFRGPGGAIYHFHVHNDANAYSGPITLAEATAVSDNSVFAQVGMHLGTPSIARQAHLLGVRSPVSTNPAMIIGGLQQGVSPLDMAHAYETLATGGAKVYNPILGDIGQGPVGIHSISGCHDCATSSIVNAAGHGLVTRQVVPNAVATTIAGMLAGVVSHGTGGLAAIPGVQVVGKTGTTTNYIDAWFCGWTPQLTTCVWVGYPNAGKPMLTNWNGQPVVGGTFPALIWRNYTMSALNILASQQTHAASTGTGTVPLGQVTGQSSLTQSSTAAPSPSASTATVGTATSTAPATGTPPAGAAGTATTPAQTGGAQTGGTGPATTATTATPAPVGTTPAAPPTPAGGGSAGSGPSGSGTSSTGGAGLGGG